MLTLEITDQAEADIKEIYLYIALESYQSYAENFCNKAFKTFLIFFAIIPIAGTERTRSGKASGFTLWIRSIFSIAW